MDSRLRGRSLVVTMYVSIVLFTGVAGSLFGAFGPDGMRAVKLFGIIELQPTAIGLAIFGMVNIGLLLGVLLGLVVFVSERYDDEHPKS